MARNQTVDLHVHSSFSDGRLSPDELVALAVRNNVVALAMTDHDTLAGSAQKIEACRRMNVECVIGMEISCHLEGREVHVLSLFADPASPEAARIEDLSQSRKRRMAKMLDRLGTMGIHIAMDDLPVSDDGVYGRPHLARALVEKGVVKNINEAFRRFLYDSGPVHIDKLRLEAGEGIALAKAVGGVAILAHPGVSGLLGDLDTLVGLGLDGIETYHPKHGGETIAKLLRYCRERGLVVSGGSDFHSPGDGADIGSVMVPCDVLGPLRELAAERKR